MDKRYYNWGNNNVINEVHGGQVILKGPQVKFDYDAVIQMLSELHKHSNDSSFDSVFPGKSDVAKGIIEEALDCANTRESPETIRNLLKELKGLSIGAGGSLIASGIIELLKNLSAC